jgi:phosphoglycerol transferase
MNFLKKSSIYLAAPALSLIVLTIIFQLWKIDFAKPFFNYNQDGLFYLLTIKNIIDTGWIFTNPFLGLPNSEIPFSLNDFPIHGELISLVIVKFLALFTNNPFLASNCFFIITFALISFTAFIALRNFKISIFISLLISVLYSFLPYHFFRNSWHLFLSNYMAVPLSIMLSMWILDGKIKLLIKKNQKFSLNSNREFFITLLLIIFIAINGLYYTFFTCWMILFAWFLFSLKEGKFINYNLSNMLLINVLLVISVITIHMPSFIYWIKFGFNDHLLGRSVAQSEIFALKIINLFLPTKHHFIALFSDVREIFEGNFHSSEAYGESLGILALTGFVFSFLWLIIKNYGEKNSFFTKTINRFSLSQKDINFISNFASLNLISILVFGSGALILLFATFFPSFRSHARFVVFIAFFCFTIMALIFDKILEKNPNKKNLLTLIFSLFFIIAILDQVGKPWLNPIQNNEAIKVFDNDKKFINEVEKILPEGSNVFILPAFGFPEQPYDHYESLICYLHSKKLHWSYPAIAGRPAAKWQEMVVNLNNQGFIKKIKEAGFSAVYIDRKKYAEVFSYKKLRQLENDLKLARYKNMPSGDLNLVLYY